MIARRTLLAGVAATAAVSDAMAQQGEKARIVGLVLAAGSLADMAGPDPVIPFVRSFVHRLRDLGWVEGRNLVIERRTANDERERAPAIMAELIGGGAEVIVVSGTPWLLEAARRTTTTVPLVAFHASGQDPASLGQVGSLARTGSNVTGVVGVTGVELPRKRMQLLKELAPQVTQIAWLGTASQRDLHPPNSGPAGTRIVHAVAETLDQFDEAFALIVRERCDAMHVGGSTVHFLQRSRIIDFAARHRLPAAYTERRYAEAGGLLVYGPDVGRLYGQMAGQVDRILQGAKAADVPVELPDKFDLIINRRTAEALGLTIPPSLEIAAEVIE